MKCFIISDIHENFHNLHATLDYAKKQRIIQGLVLGDLINPGIMHMLGKSGIQFIIVLGNNDGDKVGLANVAYQYDNLTLHDYYWSGNIDNKKVFLIHFNEIGLYVAQSNQFDTVFCGHNHIFNIQKITEKCLLLNPGEISGHMHGKSTFAVWNSEDNTAEVFELTGGKIDVKKYKNNPQHSANYIITSIESS